MGFFSKLFGSANTGRINVQSNAPTHKAQHSRSSQQYSQADYGSKSNPIVMEPPPNLAEMRKSIKSMLQSNSQSGGAPAGLIDALGKDDSPLDSMISEMMKMALLEQMFGKEGGGWESGTRLYLEGSIQSNEIVFKDGRTPVTIYIDFSKFGAF